MNTTSIEDTVLGEDAKALADKRGMERYGFVLPMMKPPVRW